MKIRVLLFVQEGCAKQRYLDALADCGVQVFVTSSFSNLSEEICSQTYHGLFLDMPTKLKAIRENKSYVYRLVEKFPVSHLIADDTTGKIRRCYFNKKTCTSLLGFINTQCRDAIPQKIREETRKELHLHLSMQKGKDDKRPERSVTKNISSGGCFIVSTHRWKVGSDIWLRFREINDSKLILAQIRTVVKWGEGRQIPGVGVEFKDLSQLHAEWLANTLK